MTTTKVRERRCSSSPTGTYNVQSYNPKTPNKRYTLTITEDGRNRCTCTAWAIKKNKLGGDTAIGQPDCTCKHIKAILATRPGCGWNSVDGEPYQFETVCPRCFEDTEIYDIPRDTTEVDLDVLMDEFLALANRLRK